MNEHIDPLTGEITSNQGGIVPALHTLREIPGLMDKVAVAIHEAISAVRLHRKGATISIALDIRLMKEGGAAMVEEPITISGEVDSKLPKPPPVPQLFFVDLDGNPTRTMKKQRGLDLQIAQPGGHQATGT